MSWLLRAPTALALLLLAAISLTPAVLGAAALLDRLAIAPIPPEVMRLAQAATWLEVGLWAGAGLFFLIAAIRCLRRTQAFWMWLLGFACFGARWALAQQAQGGLVATVQAITPEALAPERLSPESAPIQLGLLAAPLLIGVIILLLDGIDRAYWERTAP